MDRIGPNDDGLRLLRTAAQRFTKRGFQVVRLRAGTKVALEKDWPNLIRSADEFQPGDNIGLRFGPQSGGLVDIDLDFATARQLAACPAFGLDHLPEFGRASQPAGQRGHRLAIVPDGPNTSRVFGIRTKEASKLLKERGLGLTIVEIRGSNGSQSAVPPSVIRQPGEKPDRLVWSESRAKLPELSWDELNRLVGRLAFAALAAAVYPDDDQDAFCLSAFGALIESGVDLGTAERMVYDIARVGGGKEPEHTPILYHEGEGLPDFLRLSGLEMLEGTIRSWLTLQPADGTDTHSSRLDHDHAQAEADQIDAGTLKQLLDHLDPCAFPGYHDHLAILQAAHHATGGDKAACEVVVAWSAGNPEYGPGERDKSGKPWADVVRGLWKRTKVKRDGAVNTVATILHHLREAGHVEVVEDFKRSMALRDFDAPLTEREDEPGEEDPWPRKLSFRGNQPAAHARAYLKARPTRLLLSDSLLYSLGTDYVWQVMEEQALRAEIRSTDPDDALAPGQIGGIVQAIYDLVYTKARPFEWIGPRASAPRPKDLVIFNNGLFDLGSGKLLSLDGNYFATALPEFAYDSAATCPSWLAWIDERLDKEFHPTLQEFFGYAMVPDTTVHRFFSFTGPPRSGKSTAKNVLEQLVGPAHIAQKQLSDLGKEFGLQDATDKRLIVIPDARDVAVSQRGQALERILAITGGDTLSIPRKFLPAVSTSLLTRLLVLGNRQPAWIDESGALAARQIAILFDRSFEGKEDQSVEDGLMTELPGIANWALDGLRRLRKNNYQFSISDKGREAVAEVRRSTSPALRFAEDCLTVTGDAEDVVLVDDVYFAYENWAIREGLHGRRNKTDLMTDLASSLRGVQATQRRLPPPPDWRRGEYRPRVLSGVKAVRPVAPFNDPSL
ncbi:MAG: bifunctional DNA primase/polymerase [Rhizobiaceae bacterium]|nr:bifunctional DNA primase/polymerase [Rhizobiaceae bacterium]